MNTLELLLPFSLPPAELARDLLRQAQAPALARLLARAKVGPMAQQDPYARALPHESWLMQQLHKPLPLTLLDIADGSSAHEGSWFLLHPVHFHVARDHLVLTDPARLKLDEASANILFGLIQPLFGEQGLNLITLRPDLWLLQADQWAGLNTATPGAAQGHNVDIWLPQGESARAWRRLHNEVQMTWHDCEINAMRESRGLLPVNALWLWGAESLQPLSVLSAAKDKGQRHQELITALLPDVQVQSEPVLDLPRLLAQPEGLLVLDTLTAPALAQDWGAWLEALQALDQTVFVPLLDAFSSGQLRRLHMLLGDATRLASFDMTPLQQKKFWQAPSLSRLAF